MTLRVPVRPEMLRWACERGGLDEAAVLGKFPRYPAWEAGAAAPTLRQLENFARASLTPVGFFFGTGEPPVEELPIPDFRTFAGREVRRPSGNLLDTIYLCQQRQDWYRDEALAAEGPRRDFVGSAVLEDGLEEVAARVRAALGFDLEARARLSTWKEALRQFVRQAEGIGVLVMVSSVVGSDTHRKLDVEELRGFALVDAFAPLIFINGGDSKAAQMFTLAHELVHLWLGEPGVSDTNARSTPHHEVEDFCNRAAAEVLVPLSALRESLDRLADLEEETRRLARRFKVSNLVVLRRLFDVGALSRADYESAWQREQSRLADRPPSRGGDDYRSAGPRVSERFARALVSAVLEGRESYTEAFYLLGIRKVSALRQLAHRLGLLRRGAGATC